MIVLNSNWHTVPWLANEWGKHPDTIMNWARDGYLIEWGFKVIQLARTPGVNQRPQWWIFVPPDDNSSSNRQQRSSPIDTLASSNRLCSGEGAIQ